MTAPEIIPPWTILSTLIDSCFLLFSFFVVYVSTRLWFLGKKKLYKQWDWNCLKKNKSRTNWIGSNETFVYAFATDRDWQGLPLESSWNSVQEKVNCQFI